MYRPKSVSRAAGFTMIELLTILLIALVLMLISYPELLKQYIRGQLEGVARQTSFVLQKARFEAIKSSQQVQICADTAGRVVNGLDAAHPVELPDSVNFGAPSGEDVISGVDVDGNCFIFLSNGSVQRTGAFRFADVRGNFLEVQVEPQATARVQVRKWDETDNAWYTRDQGGKAWEWKTGHLF